MNTASRIRVALLVGAAAALPLSQAKVQAQEPATDVESPSPIDEVDEGDGEEIVVVGQKDPNAVIGNIPPENQLDARDVRALGATNVAELLDSIAPQTSSGRGREGGGAPVVLLNGRRISGFREVRDLPSEAILRVDILPEEVALKYGYRADQRVVNIVLRPRFRSTTTRAEAEMPTDGGRLGGEADATQLLMGEASRTSLNVRAESVSSLLESERDIRFTPADPDELDPRPFRTLEGSRRLARIGGNHNRTLFGDVSTTFDGQLEWTDGRTLLGPSLTEPGDPLRRDSDSLSGHLGLAMNGEKSRWRWSLTGVYDILRSTSETDRETSDLIFSQDHARSLSQSGNLDLVLNGSPFDLPAGPASATIRFGGATQDLESRTRTRETDISSDLGRRRLSSAINVDLPIAKRNGTLSPLGNLSLNANAEVEHLSDFGGLWVVGTGITWSPIQRLNLIVSWTREQGAPSLQQLGDPLQVTPNRRVFDFVTGETVLVDALTGGNPDLNSDTRNVVKLGATFVPFPDVDLNLRADFVRERIDNPIARFPGPTKAIEEAFPDRFQRDAEGNLIRVDQRPVNFESSARDELRWGFNFTKPLQSKRPPQAFIDQMRALRQQGGGGARTGAAEDRPTQARTGGADWAGGANAGLS